MRYAVNVADLQAWAASKGQFCGPLVLLGPVLTKEVVKCEYNRIDADAVLVREDVPVERWQAIYKIIRGVWKLHPNRDLRIYESATGRGGWKRI